ncbi:hypothetical protein [Roseateles aquatilis]|nr:hypothetical protein [Roseateles aquatilis]
MLDSIDVLSFVYWLAFFLSLATWGYVLWGAARVLLRACRNVSEEP